VSRGRFFTGEKIRDYRDYLRFRNQGFGAAVVFAGIGLGSVQPVPLIIGVLILVAIYGFDRRRDQEFEKFDRVIEQAENRGENP
jgi:hypothetical protein